MSDRPPQVVVIAGPNGAGKSTSAPAVLRGVLGITEFVNADDIARGLSGFNVEGAALSAGRIMLDRVQELAGRRVDFAFETTLASRSFAPRIASLRQTGYRFGLIFLWLPSPDYAIARVAERVRRGGHNIPEETIRRRYFAGLRNFFELYQPMADTWLCLDNHAGFNTKPIAAGRGRIEQTVFDEPIWHAMKEDARRG